MFELYEIDLQQKQVTDRDLEHLQGLVHLRRLLLAYTGITDAGLVHLVQLAGLDFLDLGQTCVTDAGLVHLVGLSRLRVLYLYGTDISDAALETVEKMPGLEAAERGGHVRHGSGRDAHRSHETARTWWSNERRCPTSACFSSPP